MHSAVGQTLDAHTCLLAPPSASPSPRAGNAPAPSSSSSSIGDASTAPENGTPSNTRRWYMAARSPPDTANATVRDRQAGSSLRARGSNNSGHSSAIAKPDPRPSAQVPCTPRAPFDAVASGRQGTTARRGQRHRHHRDRPVEGAASGVPSGRQHGRGRHVGEAAGTQPRGHSTVGLADLPDGTPRFRCKGVRVGDVPSHNGNGQTRAPTCEATQWQDTMNTNT